MEFPVSDSSVVIREQSEASFILMCFFIPARAPTKILKVCATMMTSMCPSWFATVLHRLRSRARQRDACSGEHWGQGQQSFLAGQEGSGRDWFCLD